MAKMATLPEGQRPAGVPHRLMVFGVTSLPMQTVQALAALGEMLIEPCLINGVDANAAVRAKYNTIRRALEALPE
jgi:exonuclease V gamma subunit